MTIPNGLLLIPEMNNLTLHGTAPHGAATAETSTIYCQRTTIHHQKKTFPMLQYCLDAPFSTAHTTAGHTIVLIPYLSI